MGTVQENGSVLADLKSFSFVEVLNSDSSHKSIVVLLKSSNNDENAILILEQNPFPTDSESLNDIIAKSTLRLICQNDIYENHSLKLPDLFAGAKATLINPCTEKHINKYREQERFILHETSHDYQTITLPYISSNQLSIEWVYNLLDYKAEVDRLIYDDCDPHNGFMLYPDLKWSGEQIENLYCLAIIRRRGIKSVRDLTANELPLLENIREKGLAAIRERYGVRDDQVKAYFHYQPSFYHLHVHFIHVSYDAPASGTAKAILLDDVINNISLVPDFYQKCTLTFMVKCKDPLYILFKDVYRSQVQ
ncbi:hypothetical protein AB6A40_002296 [Gnathostoma spinigerum]|uniref:m7GpppX diphosphatase n=1 Tax=Gnathostoma spinigerum TaxID=75299 RepID=A0ABD6EFX6_9BILA